MADKSRKVERILAVQTQMHRLAQWKLAELERKESALCELQENLIRFVDEDGSYAALFSTALMRRLRNVGEEKAQVQVAKNRQAESVLEELRRLGRTQRMTDEVLKAERQEQDRKELSDILERLTNRRNASPR